ncbi:MAG TPA: class I SAM-dependent methyltransferase [Thermodesulfobacteriota bacterium]|nr:class I SAM-dependent methyltransferase [Thermodesulfobacteriota bacterium]
MCHTEGTAHLTIVDPYANKPSMTKSKIGKNLSSYDVETKVESFHWWFVVRRKLLKSILSSIRVPTNSVILDIGCGAGSNLKVLLSAHLNVIGLDRSIYVLSIVSRKMKVPLLNADLNNLPVKPNSIGLIIAMDILEHLDDDTNGLTEFHRALGKEGVLLLTVPAFEFLWGIQDEVTGHKRRYVKEEITKKLREAGFDIVNASYFNFFLFFPILFGRRLIRILGLRVESENKINSQLMNFLLKMIFSLEPYILKYFSFPFGVSILCIARKGKEA